jgi:hypothetical protein
MADSQGTWMAKTIGIAILAAVLTAVLTTAIQQLVWKKNNIGATGGATAGVAVAVIMGRRKRPVPPADTPSK